MNNPQNAAAAIRKVAEGLYELADTLFDSPAVALPPATPAHAGAAPAQAASPAPASEPSPFEDEAVTWEAPDLPFSDEGSEAICPKHRIFYTAGQYGPYCQQATDDPAWGKQKGDRLWCKITPRNAAEYLRIKAAA